MKICLRVLLLTIILLFALSPALAEDPAVLPGQKVPDFSVVTSDGEELTLYGLLETHSCVLLNFFYEGCYWCELELPYLEQAYEAYEGQVAVLALSPLDTNEHIAGYRREHGVSFPMASDEDGLLAERFSVSGYPTSYLIDRSGILSEPISTALAPGIFESFFENAVSEDYVTYTASSEIPAGVETVYAVVAYDYSTGKGVEDVKISVCDDSSCRLYTTDETGKVILRLPAYPYEVHMLSIPEGYIAEYSGGLFDACGGIGYFGLELAPQ